MDRLGNEKSEVKGESQKEIFKNKINKVTVPEGSCEKDMVDQSLLVK